MTRMWMINPTLLCREHLLGEHKELHQEVGTRDKHPHGEKIVEGHAEKGQVDTAMIRPRHDILVQEMKRRGFNHDNEDGWIEYEDPIGLVMNADLQKGWISINENLVDLYHRCSKCRKRIKENPEKVRKHVITP